MRQSRKEQTTQWLMREGLMPERREAMALAAQSEEFGGELGARPAAGAGNGRRHPSGGRG
ncbi:hypothetical protein [Cohnella hongkongensis]|uniref:Uncharacterized protein n=1 Tax=Cohnella hongkongensis TaxID=178337 RepID=A0ABV9FGT4_9BACL